MSFTFGGGSAGAPAPAVCAGFGGFGAGAPAPAACGVPPGNVPAFGFTARPDGASSAGAAATRDMLRRGVSATTTAQPGFTFGVAAPGRSTSPVASPVANPLVQPSNNTNYTTNVNSDNNLYQEVNSTIIPKEVIHHYLLMSGASEDSVDDEIFNIKLDNIANITQYFTRVTDMGLNKMFFHHMLFKYKYDDLKECEGLETFPANGSKQLFTRIKQFSKEDNILKVYIDDDVESLKLFGISID